MPTQVARLPAKCRGNILQRRHNFMMQVVTCSADLDDAMLGEEEVWEDLEDQVGMVTNAVEIQAPMHTPITPSYAMPPTPLTSEPAVHSRHEAAARLNAAYARNVPVLDPCIKWIEGAFNGAILVSNCVLQLANDNIQSGFHVLYMFLGNTCGGVRTVFVAGFRVACYSIIEIDEMFRAIARNT